MTQPSPDLSEKKDVWRRIEESTMEILKKENPELTEEEAENLIAENLERRKDIINTVMESTKDAKNEEKQMARKIANDILGKPIDDNGFDQAA